MLIGRNDLEGIRDGRIDLVFRRWKRPTVRRGGTLRTAVGVLAIEDVERIEPGDVDAAAARRAGFDGLDDLLARLDGRDGELYRVRVRWAGEDPREQLRQRAGLSDGEVGEIRARLARFDAASRRGPWTTRALELVRDRPETLAAELAQAAGWERGWFKRNVRKLKELGLTESLERGYRLSPRGRAYMDRTFGRRAP